MSQEAEGKEAAARVPQGPTRTYPSHLRTSNQALGSTTPDSSALGTMALKRKPLGGHSVNCTQQTFLFPFALFSVVAIALVSISGLFFLVPRLALLSLVRQQASVQSC